MATHVPAFRFVLHQPTSRRICVGDELTIELEATTPLSSAWRVALVLPVGLRLVSGSLAPSAHDAWRWAVKVEQRGNFVISARCCPTITVDTTLPATTTSAKLELSHVRGYEDDVADEVVIVARELLAMAGIDALVKMLNDTLRDGSPAMNAILLRRMLEDRLLSPFLASKWVAFAPSIRSCVSDVKLSGRIPLLQFAVMTSDHAMAHDLMSLPEISISMRNAATVFAIQRNCRKITRMLVDHRYCFGRHAGETSLHAAVRMRDVALVGHLVESHVEVNATDQEGQTAFALAVALSDKKDDASARATPQSSPLVQSAQSLLESALSLSVTRTVMESGDVDAAASSSVTGRKSARDQEAATAKTHKVQCQIVALLLASEKIAFEKRCGISEAAVKANNLAVYDCIESGRCDLVMMTLSFGIATRHPVTGMAAELCVLTSSRLTDAQKFQLLQVFARIGMFDVCARHSFITCERTAAHICATSVSSRALHLCAKRNPTALFVPADRDGDSAMHLAVKQHPLRHDGMFLPTVIAILADAVKDHRLAPAHLSTCDADGNNLLHLLCDDPILHRGSIVKLLEILPRATVLSCNAQTQTPLHIALASPNASNMEAMLSLVEVMLERSSNVSALLSRDSKSGRTALDLAVMRGNVNLVGLLASSMKNVADQYRDALVTSLELAILWPDVAATSRNTCTESQRETAQQLACTLLKRAGTIPCESESGPCLHLAAARGYADVVKEMLRGSHRCEATVRDAAQLTALDVVLAQAASYANHFPFEPLAVAREDEMKRVAERLAGSTPQAGLWTHGVTLPSVDRSQTRMQLACRSALPSLIRFALLQQHHLQPIRHDHGETAAMLDSDEALGMRSVLLVSSAMEVLMKHVATSLQLVEVRAKEIGTLVGILAATDPFVRVPVPQLLEILALFVSSGMMPAVTSLLGHPCCIDAVRNTLPESGNIVLFTLTTTLPPWLTAPQQLAFRESVALRLLALTQFIPVSHCPITSFTALTEAVRQGCTKLITALLQYPVDVNHASRGSCPLMALVAGWQEHSPETCCEIWDALVPPARRFLTVAPAVEAYGNLFVRAVATGHVPLVRRVLDAGLQGATAGGTTLLHESVTLVCAHGSRIASDAVVDIFGLSLNAGEMSDIHAHDGNGFTPLHIAAASANATAISTLFRFRAHGDSMTRDGSNCLHLLMRAAAASAEDIFTAMTKVLAHAQQLAVSSRDSFGDAVIHVAASRGVIKALQYFADNSHGVDWNCKNLARRTAVDLLLASDAWRDRIISGEAVAKFIRSVAKRGYTVSGDSPAFFLLLESGCALVVDLTTQLLDGIGDVATVTALLNNERDGEKLCDAAWRRLGEVKRSGSILYSKDEAATLIRALAKIVVHTVCHSCFLSREAAAAKFLLEMVACRQWVEARRLALFGRVPSSVIDCIISQHVMSHIDTSNNNNKLQDAPLALIQLLLQAHTPSPEELARRVASLIPLRPCGWLAHLLLQTAPLNVRKDAVTVCAVGDEQPLLTSFVLSASQDDDSNITRLLRLLDGRRRHDSDCDNDGMPSDHVEFASLVQDALVASNPVDDGNTALHCAARRLHVTTCATFITAFPKVLAITNAKVQSFLMVLLDAAEERSMTDEDLVVLLRPLLQDTAVRCCDAADIARVASDALAIVAKRGFPATCELMCEVGAMHTTETLLNLLVNASGGNGGCSVAADSAVAAAFASQRARIAQSPVVASSSPSLDASRIVLRCCQLGAVSTLSAVREWSDISLIPKAATSSRSSIDECPLFVALLSRLITSATRRAILSILLTGHPQLNEACSLIDPRTGHNALMAACASGDAASATFIAQLCRPSLHAIRNNAADGTTMNETALHVCFSRCAEPFAPLDECGELCLAEMLDMVLSKDASFALRRSLTMKRARDGLDLVDLCACHAASGAFERILAQLFGSSDLRDDTARRLIHFASGGGATRATAVIARPNEWQRRLRLLANIASRCSPSIAAEIPVECFLHATEISEFAPHPAPAAGESCSASGAPLRGGGVPNWPNGRLTS